MKYFDKIRFSGLVERINKLLGNRDFYIFLGFLCLSTLFWFINALRGEYVTSLSCPVSFVNVPDNLVILDGSSQKVEAKVKATGFNILRQKLSSRFVPLELDVSNMRLTQKEGKSMAFLLSRTEMGEIRSRLLLGMDLVDLQPDTIFLHVDQFATRKVPVGFKGELAFEQQFILADDIGFRPDSVTVSGPLSAIDTISAIYIKPLIAEKLAGDFEKEVELERLSNIDMSHRKVVVDIKVERFSEKTISVPVSVEGLPDSLLLKTFPTSVQLTFRAGLSKFDKISSGDFSAIVDATEVLQLERPKRLRVRISRTPKGIVTYNYDPLFVEYVLERR